MKKIILLILTLVCGAQLLKGKDYYNTPFRSVPYYNCWIEFDKCPYGMVSGEYESFIPVFVLDEEGCFGIIPEFFMLLIGNENNYQGAIFECPQFSWFNYETQSFDSPENCPYTINDVYRQGDYTIWNAMDLPVSFNVTGQKISANNHYIYLSGSEIHARYVLKNNQSIVQERYGTGSSLVFNSVWYPGTYTVEAIKANQSGFAMQGNYQIPDRAVWSQIPSSFNYNYGTQEISLSNILSEPSDEMHTYRWEALDAGGDFTVIAGHTERNLRISMREFKSKTRSNLQNQVIRRVTTVGNYTLYSNSCELIFEGNLDFPATPFNAIPLDGSEFHLEQLPYNSHSPENWYIALPVYVDDGINRGIVPQLASVYFSDGDNGYTCYIMQAEPLWFNLGIESFDVPENCPYTFEELYLYGHYKIGYDSVRYSFNVSGRTIDANNKYVTLDGSVYGFIYGLYKDGVLVQEQYGNGYPLQFWITEGGVYTIKTIRNEFFSYDIVLDMNGSYIDSSPSANQNYTLTRTYQSESGDQSIGQITYTDGLGRKVQEISVEIGGNGEDIIQLIEYDQMGRSDTKSYLPYTRPNSGHQISAFAPFEQRDYYADKFPHDTDRDYPFSRKEYNGTTTRVYGPGSTGANHPVQYDTYLSNGSEAIRKYACVNNGSSLQYVGLYAAGKLTVQKVSEPALPTSQQSETYTYTNSLGQVVAKETRAGADRRITCYVYDDMGRQRYVIPAIQYEVLSATPNAVITLAELRKYCYYNEYDDHGRITIQYVPGTEPTYILYDKRGRVAMTQDGNQQAAGINQWSFTKYDLLDRPVMTGNITGGNYDSHMSALQNQSVFGETRGTALHGYSNQTYPQTAAVNDVLTVAYYDDYAWLSGDTYAFSASEALDTNVDTQHITGLQTGRKTKVLGITTNQWLTSVTYYNSKYRSIQSITDLYPEGKETVSNTHNFVGDVTRTKVKQVTGGQTYGYDKWFDFDSGGRLSGIRQQITGDNNMVTIASYTYDDLGNVSKKEIHNGLETTSYTYDLPGRQTGASSGSFSYHLWFDKAAPGMSARQDGNLAQVTWGNNLTANQKGYTFTYDQFGQMTSANYLQPSGSSWATSEKYAERGIANAGAPVAYDKNGNIQSLMRTDGNGNPLHKLEYTYGNATSGNALSAITVNGTLSTPFIYDRNGNMTKDGQTGVEIEYNQLDLPQRIFANNQEVKYIYSASGEKLATVAPDGSLTYYRSVFTYARPVASSQEQLLYLLHPEGVITKESGGWTYKYFKKDHVGSTRLLLAARGTGSATRLDTEQTTDYYPFGLAHGSLNNLHLNRYLYGGKEYQDAMLGGSMLGLYDFHARYYNPMLGRWFNVDPALQTTNPYLYCGNSPMMYVDKDGEFFWIAGIIGFAVSYVTSGVSNHEWGWKAIKSGIVGAGTAIVGAGTGMGATLASKALGIGASASGIIGGIIGGATSGIVGSALSGGNIGNGALYGAIGGMVGSASTLFSKNLNLLQKGVISTLSAGGVGAGIAGLSGGNVWEGFKTAAIGGAVGFVGNELSRYIQQSRTESKHMRETLGLTKEQIRELKRYGLGKIHIHDVSDADILKWEQLKAGHTDLKGLAEWLRTKDYDKNSIIKAGRMHIRYGSDKMVNNKAYQLKSGGINLHYDRFDVILTPVLHLLFDSIYQGFCFGVH